MLQVAAAPIRAIHRSAAIAPYRDLRTRQWYGRLIHERQSGCSHLALPRSPRTRNGRVAGPNVQRKPSCRLLFGRIAYSRTVLALGPGCLRDCGRLQNDCIDTTHCRACWNSRRPMSGADERVRPSKRDAEQAVIACCRAEDAVGAVCDLWTGPVLAIPGQAARACLMPARRDRLATNREQRDGTSATRWRAFAIKTPADVTRVSGSRARTASRGTGPARFHCSGRPRPLARHAVAKTANRISYSRK
jgi:hypothetical protein